uniref:Putative inorganic phosphate cotransporter n=3 Tax=Lygus hesperus TaxID=30085 RepID=A0A0K8SHM3_LYGHE
MFKKYGRRHEQLGMLSLGTVIDSALKVNMSFGIVAMTNHCEKLTTSAPVMSWTPMEQGLVLSCFFLGYIVLQIPSGPLSSRFSAINLLSIAFFTAGILTCLAPVAAIHGGYQGLMVVRFLTGLVQGVVYPSVKTMLSKWAVPLERSRSYSFVFGGTSLGSALTMLWGGVLAETWIGWPMLFYLSGLMAILYGIMVFVFGSDSPEDHRSMSDCEKQYIAKSFGANGADSEGVPTPWSDILLSGPLWALALTHAAGCWGYWTVLSLTPTYLHKVHHIKWSQNGYWSAIPSFVNFFMGVILAILDDKIQKKVSLSKNISRKIWNTLAFWGTAGALVAMSLSNPGAAAALGLLSFATAITCLTNMGYLMNHTDLSPNFAGTLFALTNSFANIASVLGPLISLTVITDMKELSEWNLVFTLAAIVLFVGNLIFLICGSTKIQPWNAPKNKYVVDKQPVECPPPNADRINQKRFSLAELDQMRRMSAGNALRHLDVAEILEETIEEEVETTTNKT